MASAEEEGRRTRSGRKVSASQSAPSPARATRRSSKRQAQEQLTGHESPEIIPEEHYQSDRESQPDIIKEMLAEAAQGIITSEHDDVLHSGHQIIGTIEEIIEEVPQSDDFIVFEDHVVTLEDDEHQEQQQQQLEDIEIYTVVGEEQIQTGVVVASETGIDEKSSSFPFGTVGQSETSEDAQNEEEEEANASLKETGAVESSLLASLAGDNANSLPSVGGCEENDSKRAEDFEVKVDQDEHVQPNCEKMDSDDSLSEPAIAEELAGVTDMSNATIVNTEMVSEDELPLPSKPEINDAEEVSDDELPAPQRAELPADAEVISEDELPATSTIEKKLPLASPKALSEEMLETHVLEEKSRKHKRKAEDSPKTIELTLDREKTDVSEQKKSDEQYNPMSPTSESNDSPPMEKKPKVESCNIESESRDKKERKDREKEKEKDKERERDSEKEKEKDRDRQREQGKDKEKSKDKEKDREREKDKDKEKEGEKEKERDREKEKEKEKDRKKLPILDKYWRAVKDDPADFTGWTYLLQYVDNESDAEAAREAYDAFLAHYPYCYGYWRKYADYEKRKGIKANCNAVFERGLNAIPLSVDLWIHYLTHVKTNHSDDEEYIRAQFERAIEACGLEFRSDKLWDAYIKWECDSKRYQRALSIYDRLLGIPTQGYSGHFDNFQDLVNQHSITSTVSAEELRKLRVELRESSSSRLSTFRSSKSRRGSSKEKERDLHSSRDEYKSESNHDRSSKSPSAHKETTDSADDVQMLDSSEVERDSEKTSDDLSDLSTLTEEEMLALKDRIISIRRKLHKSSVAAVTARWTYEEGIKRPYFHVKPLEHCQLKNWKDYLDFEIEKGDRRRILVLFERCLIACALYEEFWLKMIRYLETQVDQPNIPTITSDVFRRACQIHHPDKPSLHLMWAAYEECRNNFDAAAEVLENLEKRCPNLLQVSYRRINVERRRGDLAKCRELYEHYISNAKTKSIAGSLAIKYARFLNKVCNDLDGGMRVLRQTLEKDTTNTRVALQMIDLALQRPQVDEDEVVLIMDKFMVSENIDLEQKVLFAQRKVEFLEDFGSTAKGLQEAQRALQLALNKVNEAKKKRESSPSRKLAAGSKDSTVMSSAAAQAAYNNGATVANANYNYNSANSACYAQQNSAAYQQQGYDNYYNHWQYGSGYSGYGQWSGYGNYY